jgi:hypothetical protein
LQKLTRIGIAPPLIRAARRTNIPDMARLYHRTDAGRRAWDTQNKLVPLDCRRVLGYVDKDTAAEQIGQKLGWSEAAVKEILGELEAGGLVTSVDSGPDRNELDFTGSFRVEDLQAATKKKQPGRQDLDFTGPLSIDALRAARDKSK